MARPMPRVAPVTRAVRRWSRWECAFLFEVRAVKINEGVPMSSQFTAQCTAQRESDRAWRDQNPHWQPSRRRWGAGG